MRATAIAATTGSQPTIHEPILALSLLLRQLSDLIAAMSDAQYVRQPVGVIDGSFGGHVRHCLDHCDAFCRAAATGEVDYDQRERGTPIESQPAAALDAIASLLVRLSAIDPSQMPRPVNVTTLLACDQPPISCASTLERELAFVFSHTVHHFALLAAICRTLGVPTPPRFGYAPSTVAHLDAAACAR